MNKVKINLSGKWDIFFDEKKEGDIYYKDPQSINNVLWHKIDVPGHIEMLKISKMFTGPVWYRKKFVLPYKERKTNRWILKFEAVSYYCDVYINGSLVGSHEGMWDRFSFDITNYVIEGMENEVEVRVIKPGYNESDRFYLRNVLSGFIPDVAYAFGGIWGNVLIEEENEVYIDYAFIIPHVEDESAEAYVEIRNISELLKEICIFISVENNSCIKKNVIIEAKEKIVNRVKIKINSPILWDIDNPYLYNVRIELRENDNIISCIEKKFGMRKISIDGDKILLNDKPIYIRGILHWGYYPDKVIPLPNDEEIRYEIKKVKEMGFNAIKHCLYIPCEKYYEIADEEGILLWQEMPLWLPKDGSYISQRIKIEYPRIIKQIAGHPSVIIYTLGCELDTTIKEDILNWMYDLVKEYCGNVLVRDNSGSGECYGGFLKEFADFYDYHFYADLQNMENLLDTFTAGWRVNRPWMFGEFCDIDTYRDIETLKGKIAAQNLWWTSGNYAENPIAKLKPDFYISNQKEILLKNNLLTRAKELYEKSINHAMLHRKITIELVRRYPNISGYNITAIRDVPIATSGIFDDFMNIKFLQDEFKSFNSDIVLVPAWDLRRTWNCGDRVLDTDKYNYFGGDYFNLHVVVSNYSKKLIINPKIYWELIDENDMTVKKGFKNIEQSFYYGSVNELSCIGFILPQVEKPCGFTLKVEMLWEDKKISNEWVIFVYPKDFINDKNTEVSVYDNSGKLIPLCEIFGYKNINGFEKSFKNILITTVINPEIEKYIENGGKVFYMQQSKGYFPIKSGPFWRESMLYLWEHNILNNMPRHKYFELQYYGMASDISIDTQKIDNANIRNIQHIISRIDNRQYCLSDYLVEMQLGKGRIIATTLYLAGGMGKEPTNITKNVASLYLINQIVRYFINEK